MRSTRVCEAGSATRLGRNGGTVESKYFSWVSRLVFLAVMTLAWPKFTFAQTARITGTITDSSGAVVSKATITAHSLATNVDRTAESSDTGDFTIVEIPPGTYDVSVQATGFKVAQFSALVLNVDEALTLNVRLEVGAVTQTVVVAGETVAEIDTSDAQVSTVIDDRQLRELPMILRDPYQLILLTPGAIATNSGVGGFSVNGSREQNNNFKLDGADNNDPGFPGSGLATLNPDVTQEFRVINSSYLPEFGRNSGAVIDIVTRSGSNEFHGDVYEFGRWSALGARDFFNHVADTAKNPYTRNDFGVSVGGPVIKNKTFFFFNYRTVNVARIHMGYSTVKGWQQFSLLELSEDTIMPFRRFTVKIRKRFKGLAISNR